MSISEIFEIVLPAVPQTLAMVFLSMLFAYIIGLPWAIFIFMSRKGGLNENKIVYNILNGLINILRSIPGIILMILTVPLSRLIVGRAIGTMAAVVPLTFAASPFVARMFENSFIEVDKGIIEALKSMGASNFEIIKIILKETLPPRISSITMTLINLVGLSAMAGVLGGGGLGDIAIRYGYQRNMLNVLWVSVFFIILIVQIIQLTGILLYKATNKK